MRLRLRAARSSVMLTAAIAVSLAAAACSSSSPATSSAALANAGASGTLNWEWELPTSWDPVTSSAGWDMHVLGLVYASITTLDPAGNPGPGLAASWTYAPSGKSVTFTLRPDLKFTDGTPLDAQAVKENIDRGQTQQNSTVASELAVISKVVVNSATSFTLDLSQVDYQLPYLLAGKDGMMVSPKAFATAPGVNSLPTQPVGAGPFKLTSYVPDSHANLVRNPGYWDASQIHIANFTVQDITQPEEILAALESGPGQRGLYRRQPGGGGQGGRLQDRGDPVRGGERARHPDHDGAVQQPEGGRGDQLRHRPPGDRPGPAVGLRVGRLPAVPAGVRRLQLTAGQPVPLRPGQGQATTGSKRATPTA